MKKPEKDFGAQGDKAAAPTKGAIQGGVPKNTGNQSAPRSSKMNFEPRHGHGGSGKGAH